MDWSWGKCILYFILGIEARTTTNTTSSPPTTTSTPPVNGSCTDNSCFSAFPYCDKDYYTCEALEWKDYYGWIPNKLSSLSGIFVEVVCSADGDYPSADCQTFYRCKNGSATLRTCSSPGYPFFDPILERCSNVKKCPTFNCFNRPYYKIGLTDNVSPFFAYCISLNNLYPGVIRNVPRATNWVQPLVISRCFGKDVFNPNSRRCEPTCVQEGLIPDTRNCHKYYLCTLNDSVNVRYSKSEMSCPQGEAFQEHLLRCVPESLVPSCKAPFPGPV